jgi:hypothetical protein
LGFWLKTFFDKNDEIVVSSLVNGLGRQTVQLTLIKTI